MKALCFSLQFFFAFFLFCELPALENFLAGRDLISIKDLSKQEMERIFDTAHFFQREPQSELLKGTVLATCFFEPSTRTRLSFETAIQRLGGTVIGFTDTATISQVKGELLADTMQTIDQYADIIVIRHPQPGSAKVAGEVCASSVINGGDGANEHPTQALVDLFTIRQCQGKIDDLHIALVGDLKYGRTIHSLCYALSHYSVHLHFVTESGLELPTALAEELKRKDIPHYFHSTLEEVIPYMDVLYLTRMQKERFCEGENDRAMSCRLTSEHLKGVKENLRILHPFPRNQEVEPSVDKTPYAYYFQQMHNGVYVRMALFSLLLGKV